VEAPPRALQDVGIHGGRAVDGGQLLAEAYRFGMLGESLTELDVVHLIERGHEVLDVAEPADEVGGGLGADLRHTGDIVRLVALEGFHVHQGGRLDTELVADGGRVIAADIGDAAEIAQDGGAVIHELQHVAVAGDNQRSVAGLGRGTRESPDDVIGLVARQYDEVKAHGLGQLVDHRQLCDEVLVHRRAIGLVLVIELMAEGGAGCVQGEDGHVRMLRLEKEQEHLGETVCRVRGLPRTRGQRAYGVVSPVDQAMSVNQQDC